MGCTDEADGVSSREFGSFVRVVSEKGISSPSATFPEPHTSVNLLTRGTSSLREYLVETYCAPLFQFYQFQLDQMLDLHHVFVLD